VVDINLDVDNLSNKAYYETQNFFESRVAPVLGRGTDSRHAGLSDWRYRRRDASPRGKIAANDANDANGRLSSIDAPVVIRVIRGYFYW